MPAVRLLPLAISNLDRYHHRCPALWSSPPLSPTPSSRFFYVMRPKAILCRLFTNNDNRYHTVKRATTSVKSVKSWRLYVLRLVSPLGIQSDRRLAFGRNEVYLWPGSRLGYNVSLANMLPTKLSQKQNLCAYDHLTISWQPQELSP